MFGTSGTTGVVEGTQQRQCRRHVGCILLVKLASFPKVSEAFSLALIVSIKAFADFSTRCSQEFMQIMKGVDLVCNIRHVLVTF